MTLLPRLHYSVAMSTTELQVTPLQVWIDKVRSGDVRTMARAITAVENGSPNSSELLRRLFPYTGAATILGITGSPGAGKSTLVDQIARAYRKSHIQDGLIAVDPTRPYTGGANLGDRIRMQSHYADSGIYIRSMATRGSLGGLARTTADVTTVLDASGRDIILVETVGVGQDLIRALGPAERVAAVVPAVDEGPDGGDEVGD